MISGDGSGVRGGRRALHWIISRAGRVGAGPGDGDELKLRKATMVFSSLMIVVAGVVWGLFYLALGHQVAAVIPWAYSALSLVSLGIFAANHDYRLFRFNQLSLILLLPFLLMVVLGGYISSSAVIIWGFAAPLGALLFTNLRYAHRWYYAFVALVILGVFVTWERAEFSQRAIEWFFAANILGVSAVTFLTIRYFVSEKNRTLALLEKEQQKTERLLLNVLPAEIAERLKGEGNMVLADAHEEVSVLFADVVGFTRLSQELPPEEMLGLLNDVFHYFDELVAHYDVEKIRTIGDNYMVAAGVPKPRTDHAQVLAQLALEMNDFVSALQEQMGHRLQFRIGINSGPVIAGVIGQTKFHYDIWGDAVNTASRMESHGEPGKIQITRETKALLDGDFVCRRRGLIEVKGKGKMETWFLEGTAEIGD